MFLGHYAVGLAAKRVAPRTSLGVLFAAVQLVDLIWPIFLLLGWEQVRIQPGNTAFTPLDFTYYPFTHSLLAAVGWSCAAALVYWAVTRYRTGTLIVGLCVLSHWVLDFIVHRPDLPLIPGISAKVGLGLWNAPVATVILEGILFVAGIWLYVRATRPRNRTGTFALWSLLAVLVLIYASSIVSPPPQDVKSVAVFALAGWLVPFWAYWADRNRSSTQRKEAPSAAS
ncbi:MAG TPA: metal-dependent hydrolase [Rhodothermales bacterium]|nr:metal-dependent hydrolase [Rhodothermales bacterium]